MAEPARVLVLEDDASMRELLAGVLQDEGYDVVAVARGEEAVEAASRATVDLVVVDVRMEGLDGLEALALMQRHLDGAATLVVTGYASEADSVRALRLGVSDYLRKPFDLAQFLERVGRLLAETRRRRLRQAREERLRELVRWALGAQARALEGRPLPPGASETLAAAAVLAGRLAAGAGLESPEVEEIEAGAALLAAHRHFGAAAPEIGPTTPPAASEAATEGPGLAARVADLAVAAACEDADPASRWPGRFDPLLLEGLDAARAALPASQPRSRALLGLGRALVHAGDAGNAREAFARVASEGSSREAVEAWLGMAHAARTSGRGEDISGSVQCALEAARAVGPAETGRAALEGGLALLQAGRPEALPALEEAADLLGRLQLEPAASRAALALATLRRPEPASLGDPLAVLLLPEHESERLDSAGWLLPLLLEAGQDPGIRRSLARVARDAPRELARVLTTGALSPNGRRAAAGLLAEGIARVPPETLDVLAGDPDPEVRRQAEAARRRPGGPAARPVLRIRSFGPLEISLGSDRVDERSWRSSRVKHFFAYLAAQPGPVPEDRALDDFWPEDAERGRQSLYWTTSAVRRTLRGWCGEGEEAVVRLRGHLALNPALPRWHDLQELERAWACPRGPGRAAAVRRVVDLARGPFLDGCYMDWALQIRAQVERLVREALAELHRDYQQRGLPQEALECALRLLEVDPLNQEACRMVMQAQVALGRPQEAIRQYEAHCRVLRRELDVEPSLDLLELYHRARLGLP